MFLMNINTEYGLIYIRDKNNANYENIVNIFDEIYNPLNDSIICIPAQPIFEGVNRFILTWENELNNCEQVSYYCNSEIETKSNILLIEDWAGNVYAEIPVSSQTNLKLFLDNFDYVFTIGIQIGG